MPLEISETEPIALAVLQASADVGRPGALGGLDSWYDGATFTQLAGHPVDRLRAARLRRPRGERRAHDRRVRARRRSRRLCPGAGGRRDAVLRRRRRRDGLLSSVRTRRSSSARTRRFRRRRATFNRMIEAHALTKDYGPKRAVDELSFTVRPGDRDRLSRPERLGQVDHDADDPGARRAQLGQRDRERQALPRPQGSAARGRRAARGALGAHGPLGLSPPARAGADARHLERPRPRADRPGGAARGGAQAGRPVLARHGPAPGDRDRAARRPFDAAARRAGQRARPGRHPLDPQPAQSRWQPKAARSSSRRT